ncbi:damage-control phosphatase ARMT1 family protein [Thermogladius sp. 4427co]|uniref:damage-control phosphatase ARMT1 family protein n=1 Tax=Thermogladius sp. 4427co TaxID=3450718 RepID=UPI003F78F904
MKPSLECLRCLITTRLREVEESGLGDRAGVDVAKRVVARLLESFDLEGELTHIATDVFNFLVDLAPGVVEYYRRLRSYSNRLALGNLGVHLEYSSRLEGYERFRYLVKLSAVANAIDYGVAGHQPLETPLTPGFVESYVFGVDDTPEFYRLVSRGGLSVLWLFDNAGEAVYDTLLISEVRRMGNRVYGLFKEEPGFQNDITIVDAREIGLDKALDAAASYGARASSIHLEKIDGEARRLLEASDLVVAKGMSHYEYLSGVDLGKPVCYILIPKCDVVARAIKPGSKGKIVVKCS